MTTVAPYRPRPRRDPRVRAFLWEGVYHGLAFGLLAGVALWGLLLLGGAALAESAGRAGTTITACGITGALLVACWFWGYRGLAVIAPDLVAACVPAVLWLVRLFVRDEDPELQEQRVLATADALVRGALAVPAGIPVLLVLLGRGQFRPTSAWRLGLASAGLGVAWLVLASHGWNWLVAWRPPAPPPGPDPRARARMLREQAETDSALQLAVAKAKIARSKGNPRRAISILEGALRDAQAQGRSVAHLQLHWLLGWLYADTGDIYGAQVMFRIVSDLAEPGSHMHREALAALERLERRAQVEEALGGSSTRILRDDTNARPGDENLSNGTAPASP